MQTSFAHVRMKLVVTWFCWAQLHVQAHQAAPFRICCSDAGGQEQRGRITVEADYTSSNVYTTAVSSVRVKTAGMALVFLSKERIRSCSLASAILHMETQKVLPIPNS